MTTTEIKIHDGSYYVTRPAKGGFTEVLTSGANGRLVWTRLTSLDQADPNAACETELEARQLYAASCGGAAADRDRLRWEASRHGSHDNASSRLRWVVTYKYGVWGRFESEAEAQQACPVGHTVVGPKR